MPIVSSVKTIFVTCQLQCYGKDKEIKKKKKEKKKERKQNVNLASAEFAQRAIKVNSVEGWIMRYIKRFGYKFM